MFVLGYKAKSAFHIGAQWQGNGIAPTSFESTQNLFIFVHFKASDQRDISIQLIKLCKKTLKNNNKQHLTVKNTQSVTTVDLP